MRRQKRRFVAGTIDGARQRVDLAPKVEECCTLPRKDLGLMAPGKMRECRCADEVRGKPARSPRAVVRASRRERFVPSIRLLCAVFVALPVVASGFLSARAWSRAQDATPAPAAEIAGVARLGGTLPTDPSIQLVKVADGLSDPVAVVMPPDGSDRLFVVERFGRVRVIDADGALLDEPFLDLTAEVQAGDQEQGLLGLAFHPDYADNGRLFVNYTDFETNGATFVVEVSVSADDPNKADPQPGQLILAVDQPFVKHNGGTIRFGPDGYLYIALGDGGRPGDPMDNAQSRFTLLGKLLRIDIEAGGRPARARALGERPYAIPSDNPFAAIGRNDNPSVGGSLPGQPVPPYLPAVRPEIWVYGLRNPWQFTFDPRTGDLYIPDVGHESWEEINFQPADAGGGQNYGWDFLEGAHCFPASVTECPRSQVGVLPVAEYPHGEDGCAIVGVGVYRGEVSPALDGIYFSGDFCTGKVRGLVRNDAGDWVYQDLLDTALLIAGSGQDEAGELYVTACTCNIGRYRDPYENAGGSVWRIVTTDTVPAGAETAPLGERVAAS